MFQPIHIFALAASLLAGPISAVPATSDARPTNTYDYEGRKLTTLARSYELPINRKLAGRPNLRRRGTVSGETGIGDESDLLYTVAIELGNTVAIANIDTGSSDLWTVSEACQTSACSGSTASRYPVTGGNSTGIDVRLTYGDSTTGSFAQGTISIDTTTIAGISMPDQAFGVVNDTNNFVVSDGVSGIFGLGFPTGSGVQEALVEAQSGPIDPTDDFLLATSSDGPLIPRMSMTGALEAPMFAIRLSRDTIDVSGQGQLTLGKLPDGVDNSSLTWVPVRLYSSNEGGLRPPNFAPNEVYPFRWEIDVDAVYMDGQRLGDSTTPAQGVDSTRVSALVDTGNSIIRGPEDVVDTILRMVSPSFQPGDRNSKPIFPCMTPHTMAFQIGGKIFPVDPRDFVSQFKHNDATTCIVDNLVRTDPPRVGALFRWSLGDPFFRSNLVAFHYGNLTHPSVDPPRIGFMSLVPENVDELYAAAVQDALNNGGNFEETIEPAPTVVMATQLVTPTPMVTPLTVPPPTSTSVAPILNNSNSAFSNARTWKGDAFLSLIVCLLMILTTLI